MTLCSNPTLPMQLWETRSERTAAYRTLLHETLSEDDLHDIRAYLQQQRAIGRDDFRAMVEAKTHRFAGVRPAHRPARTPSKPIDK